MIKRVGSMLLCALMLMATLMSGMTVSARVQTVDFTLSVTEGKAGDTVTVSVLLPADSYFTNATMYLHYDPNVVEYVFESEVTGAASPKMNTMLVASDHPEKSSLTLVYVTLNGISKSGVLLSVDFKVKSNDQAVFSLSFNECCGADENGAEFDVTYVTHGCVLNPAENPDVSVTVPTVTSPTTKPTVPTAPTSGTTGSVTDPTTPSGGGTTTTQNDKDPHTTLSTTIGSETGKTENIHPTTTTTMLSRIDDEKADEGVSPAVVIVIVIGAVLVVAVTVIAVIAAKKAKGQQPKN